MNSVGLYVSLLLAGQAPSPAVAPPGMGIPDRADEKPRQIREVGIEEKLEAEIPSNLVFRDDTGKDVTLGDVLGVGQPTILTFNYSDCPMLCSVQLNFFAEALAAMRWDLGKQYRVVTVSLDPNETPSRAHRTRAKYLKTYGRPLPEGVSGWTFLVGQEAAVRTLADTVGFQYTRNESTGEYLHAAALIIVNEQRKVARYLTGIKPSPETLRLSLVEASEGRYTSAIDRALLYCFHYDPEEGSYALVASNIMRLGGAATVILLLTILGRAVLRRSGSHQPRKASPERSKLA
ncbi:MAG: SCO family protein [Deltaproteobacteria bacterium]|nr:SCO family protein [Deltaproteobacteria bacterium]